ncbi:hypothetical protein RB195_014788 [Necator americanus]|uniref:Poly(A) RNA polymerase mitochondrial-like central palm domain-containing protein n=1 Tax=Necator americanus TaxID=51031 RepID=A0ABR1E1Q2_NECAM
MRLGCSLGWCSGRAASSLSNSPLSYEINYQFSNEFIDSHQEQISLWNLSLLKAQECRAQTARRNRLNVDRYLSHLRSVFCNKRRSIIPIGSSVNGLNGKNSDLDLVVITDHDTSRRTKFSEKFKASEHFRRKQMNAVAGILINAKLVDPASLQQVPVLKFRNRDGIMVDLQFNNVGTIRSSLFVRTCVQFSFIVPVVVHWINSFFDVIKLKNSRHGLFSTYHLNMLALHFLQSSSFEFLPDIISSCSMLRPCAPWEDDAEMLVISDNHKCYKISPAEVIIKMIDYYSQLDLNNISIDICGKTYKRIADNAEDTFIQLIDPYFPEDTSPHARCTVRNGPSLVQQAFTALRSELLAGKKSKFFRSTT